MEAIGLVEIIRKYGILSDNNNGFLKVKEKETGIDINTMPLPFSHGLHFQEQVEALNDWQRYLQVLEKEILASKVKVLSLLTTKDDVITKLGKDLYHIKDHEGLISRATETILELCLQVDVVTLKILDLQNQSDNKNPEVVTIVVITFVKQDGLQHELNSQTQMIEHFKKLLEKSRFDHALVLMKNKHKIYGRR